MIQIQAILCRQTEILTQSGKINNYINIKKGQVCSAQSIKYMIEKVKSQGNKKVIVTEEEIPLDINICCRYTIIYQL